MSRFTGNLRGQGTVELVAVLSTSLVVALVAIALLGENIAKATGVTEAQGEIAKATQWASNSPLFVNEVYAAGGTLAFIVKNNGDKPVQLRQISSSRGTVDVSSKWLSPQEKAIISVQYSSLKPDSDCQPGRFDQQKSLVIKGFSIVYDQMISTGGRPEIISKTQGGNEKTPLLAQCIDRIGLSGVGAPCGEHLCGAREQCCARMGSPKCMPAELPCDSCGGCKEGEQCCGAAGNICISGKLPCDSCGGCVLGKEECCEDGKCAPSGGCPVVLR